MWWGDVGSNARTSDTSVVGDLIGFDINPGAKRYYDWQTGAVGGDSQPNAHQRLHRLGHLRHQARRRRAS